MMLILLSDGKMRFRCEDAMEDGSDIAEKDVEDFIEESRNPELRGKILRPSVAARASDWLAARRG